MSGSHDKYDDIERHIGMVIGFLAEPMRHGAPRSCG
jgi:hypothetical protein